MSRPPHLALPPRERAVLLGALFHGELDGPRLRQLALPPLDWAALVMVARVHYLAALLFDSVHAAGLAGSVPPQLLAGLRAEAARDASHNATLLRVAGRACQALTSAGLTPLALKGTALSLHAPRYFAVRHQSDLDLLVARHQVRAAARLLLERGFVPHASAAGLLGLDGRSAHDQASPLPAGHHLPPLTSPEGVTVELHFELPGQLPPGALAAVQADVVEGPAGLRTHGRDTLLGLLCAHVHGHHEREPAFLLRHVADVVVLLRSGAAPTAARSLLGPAVDRSLELVEGARQAVADPGRPRPSLAEAALAPGRWSVRRQLAGWHRSFGGRWTMVVRAGWRALFPAPGFMVQRYGLGGRWPLLPLTYPWRILSAVGRALLGR